MTEQEFNSITYEIIGCAMAVHNELGPGLLESVYEICLEKALTDKGFNVKSQQELPISFRGKQLDKNLVIDLLVENEIVVELKSAEQMLPVYHSQLLTYLRLANKKLGLLINFNVTLLKNGIIRKINGDLNAP